MAVLANTVSVRLGAILLAAVVLFNLVMALALFAPVGRERTDLYLLPLPTQAAAIVDVLETAPAAERSRLLDALNSRALRVSIVEALPMPATRREASGPLAQFFNDYENSFADREVHIDLRRRRVLDRIFNRREGDQWEAARIYVRLRDGPFVLLEPARAAVFDSVLSRGLAIVGLAGIVLLIGLFFAVRQTARPVATLADNARAFADRLDAPDLPETGPRELRELATAFNHMKGRIRGLVSERTRLLAAIAHDLRTYLTRLRLRADFITDDAQRGRAEQDIAEMSGLIEDTMLFAAASEGKSASPQSVDLGQELHAFVEARRELGENVSLFPGAATGRAAIGALALRRILSNLVDNALRYGGCARINAVAEANAISLIVEDDGPGIPDADLQRVLEPFERLDYSRARESGGAGLGLAIVSALARANNAELKLSNRKEGGLAAALTLRV